MGHSATEEPAAAAGKPMIDPLFRSGRARRVVFSIAFLALLVFGVTDVRSRAQIDDPAKHMSDLTCYTEAGAALLDGRDPYEIGNPRGWRYLYPPFLALLVAPLHGLHPQWQAMIWFLISVALVFGCYFECVRLLQLPYGACRSNGVGRAQGACAAQARREEASDAPPSAPTSNAAWPRNPPAPFGLRRRGASCCVLAPRRWRHIAFGAPRCISPRGARNAARPLTPTGSYGPAGASPPLAAAVPDWLRVTPFLSVVCYGISGLQLGQVSVALLYFMLLGLRLVLVAGGWLGWIAGGVAFAVAVAVKLFPALPVALLAGLLLASRRVTGALPRAHERARGMTVGLLLGVLAFVLVLPALAVGWEANLRHLRTFASRVAAPIGVRVAAGEPVFSRRNQSFLDAAQTFGTWIWAHGKIPPEPEWNKLPSPLRTPAVRGGLYGVEGGFLVLLVLAGWRLSRAGDALGLCAAFGLACTASLLLSPVSWAHSFVLTLPAAIFIPLLLWRARASWLPIAAAAVLVLLEVQIYTFRTTLKEVAVLGIGTAAWFLWMCWLILAGWPRPGPAALATGPPEAPALPRCPR